MMTNTKEDAVFQKGKQIVFRLLNIRNRSTQEIVDKLKLKKIDPESIDKTIIYFRDLDLLDDRLFAKQWITSRLAKPYGPARIRRELKLKGITPEIIETELNEALSQYSIRDIVFDLAKQRKEKYSGIEESKVKQRVYGFLQRRGFNNSDILKALKKI